VVVSPGGVLAYLARDIETSLRLADDLPDGVAGAGRAVADEPVEHARNRRGDPVGNHAAAGYGTVFRDGSGDGQVPVLIGVAVEIAVQLLTGGELVQDGVADGAGEGDEAVQAGGDLPAQVLGEVASRCLVAPAQRPTACAGPGSPTAGRRTCG